MVKKKMISPSFCISKKWNSSSAELPTPLNSYLATPAVQQPSNDTHPPTPSATLNNKLGNICKHKNVQACKKNFIRVY